MRRPACSARPGTRDRPAWPGGVLERNGDRSGRAHVFHALTDRDELVGRRLRVMAEKLCGGLMGPLLTHLVKAEALTPEELQELRQLMDQLDRKPPPKDRRR